MPVWLRLHPFSLMPLIVWTAPRHLHQPRMADVVGMAEVLSSMHTYLHPQDVQLLIERATSASRCALVAQAAGKLHRQQRKLKRTGCLKPIETWERCRYCPWSWNYFPNCKTVAQAHLIALAALVSSTKWISTWLSAFNSERWKDRASTKLGVDLDLHGGHAAKVGYMHLQVTCISGLQGNVLSLSSLSGN